MNGYWRIEQPDVLAARIRQYLWGNDDLLKGDYSGHPLAGHCFVASQAYYHLSNKDLTPMQIRHEGTSHWYLRDNETGAYIDLTMAQFTTRPRHADGRGRGFGVPGGGPCARTQAVMDALGQPQQTPEVVA